MGTATRELIKNLTVEELKQARARCRHLDFMKHCWQKTGELFIVGLHTREICNKIDNAINKYREGVSSFIAILCCFRHGKSDIVSRYLPPHFLGQFPDQEVITVSYNASKAYEFSRFARRLVSTIEYRRLYPDIVLASDNQGIEEWGIEGHQGKAQFYGFGGGSAGKGGNLIIIDDYFANRADAESEVMRDKTWECFTNDIMTRRAPTCIVIMLITPWHINDIVGRIRKEMETNDKFPQFDFSIFPAFSDEYETGTLFPERFSEVWYSTQKATLGEYGTSSLMQCNPQLRQGNMIRTDKVKYYDETPDNLRFVRGWDLASSKKEKLKSDPDFTCGVKLAVNLLPSAIEGITIPVIYIDDVVRGQWEATERNKIIVNVSVGDGALPIGIEAFAAYKDAYIELKEILDGIRSVEKMQLPGDKVAKADCLVPIFEAGNVHLKRAPWNESFLEIIHQFPSGAHDDDVDATDVAYNLAIKQSMPGMFTV